MDQRALEGGPHTDRLNLNRLTDLDIFRGRGTPSPVSITPKGFNSLLEAGKVVGALEEKTRIVLGDGLTALLEALDRIDNSLDRIDRPIA